MHDCFLPFQHGIIKQEFLNQHRFSTIWQVEDVLEKAIDYYNNRRPHRSIDMMTPMEASTLSGKIKKRWKSYKDNYREAVTTV